MSTDTRNVSISKIDVVASQVSKMEDVVAREVSVHLFIGSIHFVSILCSPSNLKDLITGHLLCEGLVNSVEDILEVRFEEGNRCYVTLSKTDQGNHAAISKPFSRLIVSSCGNVNYGSLSELLNQIQLDPLPSWRIDPQTISKAVRSLNTRAKIFRETGGVHVAALLRQDGTLVALAEDVGRHNAVDKVIGSAAQGRENLNECFLVLSGRMTGDIALKTARVGIPILASLSAPVDSGLEVAEKFGSTLIGFVRGRRMNVYTSPGRIKI
jgi:FdhD protein